MLAPQHMKLTGAPIQAVQLTCETWGRPVLSRFVPDPRSVSRITNVLGSPAWEGQERGGAQREAGRGQSAPHSPA